MNPRAGLALRTGFLAALPLLFLTGCPNPNTYTTPRTIGSGNIQHSLAAEAWGFSIPASSAYSTGETLSATFPTLPTYTLRIGLGDSWEIAARLANMSSLGGEIKWNFLRSGTLDLAIDPSIQYFHLSVSDSNNSNTSLSVGYLHLPILVGINFSRAVSLVLTPGVTYGFASATDSSTTSGTNQAEATTGAIARFGIGFDFRMTSSFALHPEITFLRGLGTEQTILYMFGLGFNFGSMPNYDDVGGGPAPAPPPSAPPPGYYPPPAGTAPPPGEPAPAEPPQPPLPM
ncbi:MAG TPA: hypothetical protein VKZ18_02475 [Polyangia bacterium]|nr:hypothetical protein [Polyangia bacterium]